MKIIILGAGRVGSVLAEHLSKEEGNQLTIVDNNRVKLDNLLDRIDVQVVWGEASFPQTLIDANCDDADLIIAVSRLDEMNILACTVAHKINPTAKKICRVRAQDYWKFKHMFDRDGSGRSIIDSFISPQRVLTRYIERLIETPGALQAINFADGLLRLIVVKAHQGGLLVGKKIMQIKHDLPPNVEARIVAIYRKDTPITPDGAITIEIGDEVFFIAETIHIQTIMNELRKTEKPYKKIAIAGGGLIGYRLAQALEKKVSSVKLLENNRNRLEDINPYLENTVTLWGDATNPKLLLDEHINDSDVFIAVTNSDECNILSCMLAKSLNTKKVMALVNRPEYVSLLEESQIDVAISPDQITISSILTYVRSGNTASAHPLRKGVAETLEVILTANSKVINKRIDEASIPKGITVGAIIRRKKCIIAHRYVVFEKGDHVILFVAGRKFTKTIEKLFGTISR